MKTCLPKLLLSFGLCAFAALALSAAESVPSLRVMTYNLRYASDQGPNAWPDRRPLMRELIQRLDPDVFGSQEGLARQLRELASDLPAYAWAGQGRDGGEAGEFMAVFYKKSRLETLSTNHFWLSATPDTPATTTWGNQLNRMVTWLKFRDRETRREFYFFNTHFDHLSQPSREKSAELVRERAGQLGTKLPILLTGDFNATSGENKAYDILVGDGYFRDTWKLAKTLKGEEFASFNNFQGVRRNGKRIDWILARGPVSVSSSEVVPWSKDGKFPSDHCPVVIDLQFGE